MSFLDRYKDILKSKFGECIVATYSKVVDKYEFLPFTHVNIDNWSDKMFDLLATNLIGYCYYENEIDDKFDAKDIDSKLEDYIKHSIQQRLNERTAPENKDGLCGELLIDLLVRYDRDQSSMLLCRPLYQEPNNKQELKNYDLMLFENNNGQINLILGQSKSGQYQSCQTGIQKDLNEKYKNPYFADSICYVKERHISSNHIEDEILNNILKDLNSMLIIEVKSKDERNNMVVEFIKSKNIKLIIPCLLFYTKDEIYCDNIQSNINNEISQIKTYFADKHFDIQDIEHQIIFYIFPCKDVVAVRQKMVDYKKKVLA